MAENLYNPADLNSVLRTLSNLAPQGSSQATSQPPHSSSPAPLHRPEQPRQPQPRPPRPSNGLADPSNITTWPAALRHVMRTVGHNEELQHRIRGMIRSQHHHERQWFSAREALIKQQRGRPEKQKELDAVLRSIGAPVDTKEAATAEQDFAIEIAAYDAKVHRAASQMSNALTSELRGFGIPFFKIHPNLIQDSSTEAGTSNSGSTKTQESDITGATSQITKSELEALQQRMLDLLEDLCKE
ncbi:uncharacterized protein N7511_008922 [Penicillium nucicola]|uniref:uncharacterized protein n=1 Tax=Penicillium nucicola TaxID=1850975 RepID=UPI0025453475|nr:uncharacterized protein N7511_008922 [Penicillium nucicola]KAJ5747226.1 hypothetical protein N7511_008922 [Penicillium nucicola]